ncbi:MAG: flavin reductase family protein [Eubacteriales bacterium]|nr:flavin reductase family protein [Eubacteriales bacterium]
MAKKSFKPGTMLNPVPVVMASCGDNEKKNIITIAWTGIINSEPPMTYISVRKSRYSHSIIKDTGEFVINLTTENLAKETDFAGVKSGRDVDKFKELKLTPEYGEITKCPMIKESPVNLECKVVEIKEFGSHDMFIGEIVKVHVDEELIDEKGKILLEEAKLLCYNHGEYFGIKRYPLGKFGFSIMKPKTRKRINREKHKPHMKKKI